MIELGARLRNEASVEIRRQASDHLRNGQIRRSAGTGERAAESRRRRWNL